MAVDSSIYNMLGRGVKSVADYDREHMEGQQNMLALQGQRLKMDEYQRGLQRQQNLLALSGGWNESTTDDQRINALKNRGYFSEADSLTKTLLERQKAGAEVLDKTSQANTRDYDLMRKKLEHGILSLQTARSAQEAAQMMQQGVSQGLYTMQEATRGMREMPQDQASFEQWRVMQLRKVLDAEKQLPKIETRNLGGTTQTAAIDPVTGEVRVMGSTANTQSPDSAASTAQARARLQFDREQAAQGKWTYDPERGGHVNAQTGDFRPATLDGKPIAPKKPSDQQQKVTDATEAIAVLDQAEELIGKSTGSYAGVAVDETARAFGKSTAGAEAAAKLKALEGSLIAKMPKMSGPQSDKDVLLYKQMAGQIGDPTIPADTKRAAVETIREIQERQAGLPKGSTKPRGAGGSWDGTDLGGGFRLKK